MELPELPETVPVKFAVHRWSDRSFRPPMMVSMGPQVLGVTLPHPDQTDTATMMAGTAKRVAVKMPTPNRRFLRKLKRYAKDYLETFCQPLSPDADLSFDKWLEERPYPEWRKKELIEVHERIVKLSVPEQYRLVKAFMKDETYPEFKHARGIYARCDEFKVIFGPLVAAIEKIVYSQPEFIKKVPVDERPKYIQEMLKTIGHDFAATDYTSFETSFTEEVMKATDQVLFEHFTKRLKSDFYSVVFKSLLRTNHVRFKWFTLDIKAKRMSGEMNTSLGNGFANMIIMKFLCHYLGCGDVRMVVEGDDGLATTPTGKFPTTEDFLALGFKVKLELHKDVSSASFCGIVYHPDDLINVTDPMEVLASFGWASQRYARSSNSKLMALLRSKALCYLHQYSGSPIIQELALYGLRMTRSYNVKAFVDSDRNMSMWEREQVLEALNRGPMAKEVGNATRLLVESKYGISVEEQKNVEQYLREKNDLSPLKIDLSWKREWLDYNNRYVREIRVDSTDTFVCTHIRVDLDPLLTALGSRMVAAAV